MQFFHALTMGSISIEITILYWQWNIGRKKYNFDYALRAIMTIGFSRDTLRIRLCDPKGKTLEGKHLQNRLGYYEVLIPPNALRGNKEVE